MHIWVLCTCENLGRIRDFAKILHSSEAKHLTVLVRKSCILFPSEQKYFAPFVSPLITLLGTTQKRKVKDTQAQRIAVEPDPNTSPSQTNFQILLAESLPCAGAIGASLAAALDFNGSESCSTLV